MENEKPFSTSATVGQLDLRKSSWSRLWPYKGWWSGFAPSQVIQADVRNSWSSTQLWRTRGAINTAQDTSVFDNAFVLIDAMS